MTRAIDLTRRCLTGLKEIDIEPGDALLFNIGWRRLWPDRKIESAPHAGKSIAVF